MSLYILDDIYILRNLGIKGKYLITFAGTLPLSVSLFHLEQEDLGEESFPAISLQYNVQSLGHTWIFSYPKPKSMINFLAW